MFVKIPYLFLMDAKLLACEFVEFVQLPNTVLSKQFLIVNNTNKCACSFLNSTPILWWKIKTKISENLGKSSIFFLKSKILLSIFYFFWNKSMNGQVQKTRCPMRKRLIMTERPRHYFFWDTHLWKASSYIDLMEASFNDSQHHSLVWYLTRDYMPISGIF